MNFSNRWIIIEHPVQKHAEIENWLQRKAEVEKILNWNKKVPHMSFYSAEKPHRKTLLINGKSFYEMVQYFWIT